ncbi:MAG: exopolysaccharide biosynthesis polyprenyl glycosylphosphotransferase [Solirubrobacterales bacterium]
MAGDPVHADHCDDPAPLKFPNYEERDAVTGKPRPRPNARRLRLQLMFDALMLIISSLVVLTTSSQAGLADVSAVWQAVFVLAALAGLWIGGAYKARFALHFLDDLRLIIGATAFAAMLITFTRELLTLDEMAAPQAVRAWIFAAIYLAAGRGGAELAQGWNRKRSHVGGPTLIVGAGKVGTLVAERLLDKPAFGLRPVAFLDDNPLAVTRPAGLPVYRIGQVGDGVEEGDGSELVSDMQQLIDEFAIEHVIVAFSLTSHTEELEMMRRCEELGVSVSLIPRLFERVPDRTRVERLGGIPLITVHPSYPKGWQFAVKYILDRAVALFGLIVISPLLLVISIAVMISLGRPILFRQPRLGVDGQTFELLKFRTMRPGQGSDADEHYITLRVARNAPGGVEGIDRRSRLGKFLRATSLDELPQLFNVLRGDMSMVGPRPERVAYARVFEREVYRYAERHRVKSGITGWAQIHKLRGNSSLEDRVEWDNYYIENWSPWLDLKILLKTPLAALRDRSE